MNPVAAHGNSGWTQATKTASRMGENSSSFRSESSGILDYKLIVQLPFNIKLQHCGDHQLVPQGWTTSTPGEQCRTQVPTQAGSGDLFPKLGEETAPSLVQDQRAASRRSWQCYKVLVIVKTKPLWCSVLLTSFPFEVLATKPATKFLGAFVNSCYDNYSNWLFFAVSYTSMETVDDGYTYQNKVLAISHRGIATCLLVCPAACSLYIKASKNGTSHLSLNTRGAQVWRVTKHRPG